MAEPTYNPATDVHAGELREAGMDIDESIPDCAWVPRSSMRMVVAKSRPQSTERDKKDPNLLSVAMDLHIDEPFRWINIDGTVEL